jgi:hypothetical protein
VIVRLSICITHIPQRILASANSWHGGQPTVNTFARCVGYCLVACFISMPGTTFAGKSYSVVGRAPGVLAVQELKDGPWRTVAAGGILPDVAEVRTSGDGPCQFHLASGDSMFLGPLTQVKFDLTARRIQLLAGRVFTTAPAELGWSIHVGETSINAVNSAVETALMAENEIAVSVVRGSAKVTVPGADPFPLQELQTRT